MAALSAVPYKLIACSSTSDMVQITQLMNGVSMSNVWVMFEYMDKLPLVSLSILLKEIQLIHQQFIVSNFKNALIKDELERNMDASKDEINLFD